MNSIKSRQGRTVDLDEYDMELIADCVEHDVARRVLVACILEHIEESPVGTESLQAILDEVQRRRGEPPLLVTGHDDLQTDMFGDTA